MKKNRLRLFVIMEILEEQTSENIRMNIYDLKALIEERMGEIGG